MILRCLSFRPGLCTHPASSWHTFTNTLSHLLVAYSCSGPIHTRHCARQCRSESAIFVRHPPPPPSSSPVTVPRLPHRIFPSSCEIYNRELSAFSPEMFVDMDGTSKLDKISVPGSPTVWIL
ncbi:unnamed protein product [Protopolystoma xenopodis]|uniref:Uncharacterized protein n=1 Tax=Protopolystoma xenopodis TaxID=117903 RepID=A0A448WUZ0_9PLAT|nr:unnamed protein product [Protopolystoma xenopodis]